MRNITPKPDARITDKIVEQLKEAFSAFLKEYDSAVQGNKSAAIRSRNFSVAMGKGLALYRKASVEFWK